MSNRKIAVGADHAGFDCKKTIIEALEKNNFTVKDFGTFSSESVDYPDYVHPLAKSIESKEFEFGILLCGSANGVAMAANKHKNIRAAIAWLDELAALARKHNDANILCIPARYVSEKEAVKFTLTFLNTSFEGGRHSRRVDKIGAL